MSYSTSINDNQVNLGWKALQTFFDSLGVNTYKSNSDLKVYSKEGDPTAWKTNADYSNYNVVINNKTYTIKNTKAGEQTYNLYDLIAVAKSAGIKNTDIANALNDSGIRTLKASQKEWTNDYVKSINSNTTSASKRVQEYLDKNYPNANAYVSVVMNKDGNGYTTRVVYQDPDTKTLQYVPLEDLGTGKLSDSKIAGLLGTNTNLGTALKTASQTNSAVDRTQTNAQAQGALADKVLSALGGNIGSNANAANDLTQSDIDAVTANLPGTENLQAWNQSKNTNALSTALKNVQSTDPDLITRSSLQELQDLAGDVSAEQLGTTQRNLNNQQKQLLQQIQRDPALYESMVQQLRADNAAGTIAGQRAANAQQLAAQADTTYDKSASDLYSSLFTGDTAVAGAARNNAMSNQVSASDASIQSMLNNAIEAARQGQISSQDLATFINSMSTALDTDASTYDNAIAENQAAAGTKASDIASKIDADTKTQIATNDAKLQQISNMLGVGTDYLQSATNGSADISAALQTIIDGFTNNTALSGGYKKVDTPAYKKAEQFDNKQYTDFLKSDAFKNFLSNDTIDALTKSKTIEEILNDNSLDMLTEDGMKALYEGYAKDANEQSDRVFNQAQRAYIAAVTAGDTKTTEQLTKLAANAGTSKSNLYATSAFANQLKQQFGLNNTGRQLASDFQNQQSANRQAISNAALSANKALTGYIGNGTDGYDAGTVYAVKNLWDTTKASNRQQYGSLGNKLMSTTQGLNTSNVSNNINNYDRLAQLASQYTAANAAAAANNTANGATRNSLKTNAQAMQTQAQTTLNDLNKKK